MMQTRVAMAGSVVHDEEGELGEYSLLAANDQQRSTQSNGKLARSGLILGLACLAMVVTLHISHNAIPNANELASVPEDRAYSSNREELKLVMKPHWYLTSQPLSELSEEEAMKASACTQGPTGTDKTVDECEMQVCATVKVDKDGTVPHYDVEQNKGTLQGTCCYEKLLSNKKQGAVEKAKNWVKDKAGKAVPGKIDCSATFGCFPSEGKTKPIEHIDACKAWFCNQNPPLDTTGDWEKSKNKPEYADDKDKGTGQCCYKLFSSWKINEDICASDAKPEMDAEACAKTLCAQDPPITDNGFTLMTWKEQHSDEKDKSKISLVNTCVSKLKVSGDDDWTAICSGEREKVAAAELERKSFLEDMVGKRLTADDLKTIEAIENPNADGLVPVDPAPSTCTDGQPDLPALPGTDVLGAGYDPLLKTGCKFDKCMTRNVFQWTYKNCRALHSPAGTFSVPDQIKVFNIYSVNAQTKVYMSEDEEQKDLAIDAGVQGSYSTFSGSFSAAASFGYGSSKAKASASHKAVRTVDIDLYSLRAMAPVDFDGLSPDFVSHYKSLPERFGLSPHRFLDFIRVWGRFVSVGGNWGGSLDINMKFQTSSSASKRDIALGVEAAYDGMFQASGHFNMDISKASKNLASNSEISLEANGGDPAIAGTITDLQPGTEKTAMFRADFMGWIKSVPMFPRMAQRVPRLQLITEIIPVTGNPIDALRRKALEFAVGVFSSDPSAAIHASTMTCHGGEKPTFTDFNRFQKGDCLAFSARGNDDIQVEISGTPGDDEGGYLLDITRRGVFLYKGEQRKEPIAKTMNPSAFAGSDASLLNDYWVCLTGSDNGNEVIKYGKGSTLLFKFDDANGLVPQFFGLGCKTYTQFSAISVYPEKQYKLWTEESTSCVISKCSEPAIEGGKCICKRCKDGYRVVEGGNMCDRVSSCPNRVGCTNMDSSTCECKSCCCGLALHPTTKACLENGVWTPKHPNIRYTSQIGNTFGKNDKMDIEPLEFFRIKDIQMFCSENGGLHQVNVRHTKIKEEPPEFLIDRNVVTYGALVGDDSYGDDNLLLRAWLDQKPEVKSLFGRLKKFFKGGAVQSLVSKMVPFAKDLDLKKVSSIFKKGAKALKKHGGKLVKAISSGDLSLASFAGAFGIDLNDPNLAALMSGGKGIIGKIAKGAIGAIDAIDAVMNDSPIGNVIGMIPGVGQVASAVGMAAKFIPTDVAKVAVDAVVGEEVPLDKVLEKGMQAVENKQSKAATSSSRMLLSKEGVQDQLLTELAEAREYLKPTLSATGGLNVLAREHDWNDMDSDAQFESLAWKWALISHHDEIMDTITPHAHAPGGQQLSPMSQRRQQLFLKGFAAKAKAAVQKIGSKVKKGFKKAGKAVVNTVRVFNPDLADKIEDTAKSFKQAIKGVKVDIKTMAEFLENANLDELGFDPELQSFETLQHLDEDIIWTPRSIAMSCRESVSSDQESGVVDLAIHMEGRDKPSSAETFDNSEPAISRYISTLEGVIEEGDFNDYSQKYELESDEYFLALQISRTMFGVQSVTGFKTNKKFYQVQCGPETTEETTYSYCPHGTSAFGLYGAVEKEKGLRSVGLMCTAAVGDWQILAATDPYFYPQIQAISSSYLAWPTRFPTGCKTKTKKKKRWGGLMKSKKVKVKKCDKWGGDRSSHRAQGFKETKFGKSDKARITSFQFFCSKDDVEAVRVGYTDGRKSWTENIGGVDQEANKQATLYTLDDDEVAQGLTAAPNGDGRYVSAITEIITSKRAISVASCGNSRDVVYAKTRICADASGNKAEDGTFVSGLAGLYGFQERKDTDEEKLTRLKQIGLVCATAGTNDALVEPRKQPKIELDKGEYLTGMVGVMNPEDDNKVSLGGVAAVLTNQKVIPTECGSEVGERRTASMPNNAMPINFFGSDRLGTISSLGIQYMTIPTEAENGFILTTKESLSETAGVGKAFPGALDVNMQAQFFDFYIQRYLRLELLEVQCVYDGGFSHLSFLRATFSNKDRFEIGTYVKNTINVFDRKIELRPNENLESLDLFVNKNGLLSGISAAVTDRSESQLNCGHGVSTQSIVASDKQHIVGFNAQYVASKTKADRGYITSLTALTIEKVGE